MKNASAPLLIIAGPGSGKTEVIALRIAHLVRLGLARPEEILAVTFTEKAALSLKDRVQARLPAINAELMHVSTIHSFCSQLMCDYPDKIELQPKRWLSLSKPSAGQGQSSVLRGFRILDAQGQFLFVYTHRKALGLDEFVKGQPQDFYNAVIRTFNLASEELVDPADLESWCQGKLSKCGSKEIHFWEEWQVVARAYRRYGEMQGESGLVDFPNLQRYALNLLENNPDTLKDIRTCYPEILVDEYQDTNAVQERLFRLLSGDGRRLTVVGDDDQSIYGFRGATLENMLGFPERYPSAKTVHLPHNFRSLDPIVDHSQEVIANNPARYPKRLLGMRGEGSEVVLIYERSAPEEAEVVAGLTQRLHRSGHIARYGDIAILLRSVKSYAGPYIDALTGLGIPRQVTGDASLFESDAISQLYDLFNFLGTSRAWGDKYLQLALVGLSPDTRTVLKANKDSLLEFATDEGLQNLGVADAQDRQRLLELLKLKRKVLHQKHASTLGIFYDVLAATDCLARFEVEGRRVALCNLGIFSALVAAWDEYASSDNFYPFREYLKLMKQDGVDPWVPPTPDAVQVMTIHQSKGLEFPVVVLGAAMDGRLPITRRKDAFELPYELRASEAPEVPDPHIVDERKLFYVAATRARDLLIVGTADVVNKRGGGPSRFLEEMFGPDLKAAAKFSEEKIEKIVSRPAGKRGPRPRHSFSRLAYYLECPVRYKYAVVYGLQVPWLDPVDFGANVHRCLEAIHRRALQGKITEPGDLPDLVEENWLATSTSDPEQEGTYKQAALRQLQRYLQEHGDSLARALHAETHFSAVLQDDVLTGKIDLVPRAQAQAVEIVDFKTSDSDPEAVRQAETQLHLYALGMEASLDRPVAGLTAHFLGDGEAVSWDWSQAKALGNRRALGTLFERIRQEKFPPRRAYCARCEEFRAVCPYYDPRG